MFWDYIEIIFPVQTRVLIGVSYSLFVKPGVHMEPDVAASPARVQVYAIKQEMRGK